MQHLFSLAIIFQMCRISSFVLNYDLFLFPVERSAPELVKSNQRKTYGDPGLFVSLYR